MWLVVLAVLAALGVSLADSEGPRSSQAATGCNGHVAVVDVSRGKYPAIVAHIRAAQAHGQPRRTASLA